MAIVSVMEKPEIPMVDSWWAAWLFLTLSSACEAERRQGGREDLVGIGEPCYS